MLSENIEQAIYISAPSELSGIKKGYFSRVYYGAEFCESLIPGPGEIKEVLRLLKEQGLSLTFLTPYSTDAGVRKLEKALLVLPEHTEVAFNDFGVFKKIKEMRPGSLRPILGRMMVKYKRDPRITTLKTAKRFMKYLMSSNINPRQFQRFLLANQIKRIEIENSFQGYNFKLNRDIRSSLYYPYVYISTAVRCVFKKILNLPDCNHDCKGRSIKSSVRGVPVEIITKGNTEFYFNDNLKVDNLLRRLNVDRVVFFPKMPF